MREDSGCKHCGGPIHGVDEQMQLMHLNYCRIACDHGLEHQGFPKIMRALVTKRFVTEVRNNVFQITDLGRAYYKQHERWYEYN